VLPPLQLLLVINIYAVKNPRPFDHQKFLETTKYINMRFFVSQKLNTKGGTL
jgi:hypothetical protein